MALLPRQGVGVPYKDKSAQRANAARWRQDNLFEIQQYSKDYETNQRVRPDEYHVGRHARRQAQYERESGGTAFVGCDGEGMGIGAEHDYYVWPLCPSLPHRIRQIGRAHV